MTTQSTNLSLPDASVWAEATWDRWREQVEKDLNGAPFEKKLVTHTYEGIDIPPLLTARDWDHSGDRTGFPGQTPMVRGGEPVGGVRSGWEICEERLEPDPASLNRTILDDLEHGVGAIDLRLNHAAATGVDLFADGAETHIESTGAMILSLSDLDAAMSGVHPEMIRIGMTAGAGAVAAAGLLAAFWRHRGIDPSEASGAFNADPLADLAREGSSPVSMESALAQLGALASWTRRAWPGATSVRVGTHVYHDAGATAAQDLGFSMATAVAYLRAMEGAGLSVDDACRQITFGYSISCNMFLAIAKLRAARRLWDAVAGAAGADEASRRMHQHVRTGRRSLTHRDPWVNMLRNTSCCFASGVAGADSFQSIPFDAALGAPGVLGRRVARNTQIVLQEEAHIGRVADPSGGSWYVEWLTDQLAQQGWAFFREIEAAGGMTSALTSDWARERIDSAFAPRAKNIARRKDAITGVSEFPNLHEQQINTAPADPGALARSARERLSSRRPAADLQETLERTRQLASSGDADRLMESIVDAFVGGASMSEAAACLRRDSDPLTITALAPHPYAQPFEDLRDASDEYEKAHGHRPTIFYANMGRPAQHNARTNFCRSLFEAGGFESIASSSFASVDEAAKAFGESGVKIAVICSTDPMYEELVPTLAPTLKSAGARTVILAGNPGAQEAAYREAGVDRFVFIKCDVLATLRELLTEEGVLS